MGLSLGNTNIGEIYLGSTKISEVYLGSSLVFSSAPAPAPIAANTVRVRTNNGNAPYKGNRTRYETATLVPGTSDVYDVYKSGTDFTQMFRESNNVIEVLGANTSGVTNMLGMFWGCSYLTTVALFDTSSATNVSSMFSDCTRLTTVALFDTSSATNMSYMFGSCNSLTTVPLFDTSSATNVSSMFSSCYKVESGALALYQQMSSQANPPSRHNNTFIRCGRDTTTGAAELAQIPSSWGGTGA